MPYWKTLKSALNLTFAILTALMLASCAASNSAIVERSLPPSPAWVVPATVKEPADGESILAVAARERAAKAKANKTITEFRHWYEGVRDDYAGETNQ